jgi:hypothetical protein
MSEHNTLVPMEHLESSILLIRGQRVMLDSVLAGMYGVETKAFNRAILRNINRFPRDFMFQLTEEEFSNLRSQIATSSLRYQIGTSKKEKRGGRRYLPYAFTEYGVAMLSSVLKSERAIAVNIEIMRTFGKYRRLLVSNEDLMRKINKLEKEYDENFQIVFKALKNLMKEPEKPNKQPIGFITK